MDISPEEASKSLEQVDRIIATTRTAAAYAGADLIFALWGVAWTFGFAMSQVLENLRMCALIGPLWCVTVAAAVALTLIIVRRYQAPVHSPEGKRIGFLWFATYAYFWVFALLGYPFFDGKAFNTLYGIKFITAMHCLVPMFVYVVMGLWLQENYLIVFAILMTAITVAGFLMFSGIFWIWMAVLGGGSFLAVAVYMRLQWRAAMQKEQGSGAENG